MEKIALLALPLANTLLKADSKRTNNLHLLRIRDRNRIRREKILDRIRRGAERLTQPDRPPSVAVRRKTLRLDQHVSQSLCSTTDDDTDFDPREDGDSYLNDIEYLPGDPADHNNQPEVDHIANAQMPPPTCPVFRPKISPTVARAPSMRINARKFALSKKKSLKIPH